MRFRPAVALLAGLLLPLTPAAGRTQQALAMLPAARECLQRIPPSEMRRVVVYVAADIDGATSPSASASALANASVSADALASAVADRVRARFGRPPGVLPPGDSLLGWMGLDSPLRIVARRDAPLRWRYDEEGESTDGAALLARAMQEAVESGETFVWPDGVRADSIVLRMRLAAPTISRDGSAQPINARAAIALFTLPIPWEEPVRQQAAVRADVGRGWLAESVHGYVYLDVVVDTAGHVDPELIRVAGPLEKNGEPLRELKTVWAEARHQATRAQFDPERIGGCAVPVPFRLMIPFTME